MRQFFAVLGDSLREARDRRSLYVLLGLSALMVVLCFSLAFEKVSPGDLLREQAAGLGSITRGPRRAPVTPAVAVEFKVGDARPVVETDGFGSEMKHGWVIQIDFADAAQLDQLVAAWEKAQPTSSSRAATDPAPATGARTKFLEQRLRALGYSRVRAQELPARTPRFLVAATASSQSFLRGGHRLTLFFGLARIPLPKISAGELLVAIEIGLADVFCGSIGMLIALLVCAGFVPNMLQKGTLDLVLARPIGRVKLLLAKYVGGLWFVGCIATFLIAGCWLGLSLRTGAWSFWFLLSIPILLAQFAVAYSVAVLVGVVTRSAGVAALASLALWMVSGVIVGLRHQLREGQFELPGWADQTFETLYAVLPKTADLALLGKYWISKSSQLTEVFAKEMLENVAVVDWGYSLGTTAAFLAAVLGLASWLFSRRDF